jgi:ribA/ribD-fused uncharacterized protein
MSWDDEVVAGLAEDETTAYRRADCAVFRKTAETWGEYSNMAPGFPVVVNGVCAFTSEALYQCCRFPHLPDVQRTILAQASPMAAKMKGKPHRKTSRPDFDALRVRIMWWALRAKLAGNLRLFGRVLLASGSRPIVEDSHKDTYWGATADPARPDVLTGRNVLGRLLVRLRDGLRERGEDAVRVVEPPGIEDFVLVGDPIGVVRGG